MTYLPYLLLTPLVWFTLAILAQFAGHTVELSYFLATIQTLALWGLLLLVIK